MAYVFSGHRGLGYNKIILCVPKQVASKWTFSNVTSKGKKVQHFVMPIFPNAQDSEETLSGILKCINSFT